MQLNNISICTKWSKKEWINVSRFETW